MSVNLKGKVQGLNEEEEFCILIGVKGVRGTDGACYWLVTKDSISNYTGIFNKEKLSLGRV